MSHDQKLPSVDWLIDHCCGRRPLLGTDADPAQQQEDHGSSQTNGHHADDQRRERVDGWRADAHQQRPKGNRKS